MNTPIITVEEIITTAKIHNAEEKTLIEKAYAFAKEAHAGQLRNSGDPYFIHVAATGYNLAAMNADATTIAAGIMHDVLEDTPVTRDEMQKEFGDEIVFLVEGVTKLGTLKYKGVERHAESLRKFFIASATDIRVVMIKLADRLNNVQTLEFVRPDKQARIALETLEIHARLADRLGMGRIKSDLEDASFPFAYPAEYKKVDKLVAEKTSILEVHLGTVAKTLKEELSILGAQIDRIDHRVKHLYSLWQKLQKYDYDIDKIHDILALRIIVPTTTDCYQALGIIHGLYKPLPGRFKDYIAVPKANGYKSLHTTIFDGTGSTVEIQIRTGDMHNEAEYGIASHVHYKEIGKNSSKEQIEEKTSWTRDLLEAQKGISSPDEFLSHLKLDFFKERVFVYTPKGDVIELPLGSCAIDFAYAIHSDLGNHLLSAKVNNKMVSIDHVLSRGDIVSVETNKKSKPNRKWLSLCKTTLAKQQIRRYLREHGGVLDKVLYRDK